LTFGKSLSLYRR